MTATRRLRLRLKTAGLIALTLVPPLTILALILTHGVNMPFLDDWTLVPFVLKAHAGTVTFTDLWAQHNEHRIASIRLIVMLLLPSTRFNAVGLLMAAYCMAVVSLALFWRALCLTSFPGNSLPTAVVLVPVSFLTFSTVQYESWLYILPALQWQLVVLCAALTVWSIARWPGSWKALAVAVCCTIASALAIASGFALLPAAVIGTMLSARSRRWRWAVVGLGTVVLGVLAFAYLVGYVTPAASPSPLRTLFLPRSLATFVLAYFGAPFSLRLQAATVFGAAGVALAGTVICVALRRSDIPRACVAPWVALSLYAVGFAIILAVGRAGLGADAALARRYPATAALLWVSTAPLLARLLSSGSRPSWHQWRRAPRVVLALGVLAVETGYLGTNLYAMLELESLQRTLAAAREELVVQRGPGQESAFRFLLPWNPEIARDYSRQLQEAGLGPYSNVSPPTPRAPQR